jgi:hypothetical protein
VQHLAAVDTVSAKSPGVDRIADFEYVTGDILRMPLKKAFDEMAIDGLTAVDAEFCTYWLKPTR